jgi:hypothetical protein
MNRLYLALIVTIVLILGYAIEDASSDVTSSGATTTQSNVSGSNTSIQGYEATTNNTYQGQVTNSTTNSTSNSTNQETAVNSSYAPAMSVYSQDSCSLVISGGVTVMGISFSGGGYVMTDEACERLKKAKMLKALSMSVASISIMCDDPAVFDAMYRSGTPCPVMKDGKSLIGEEAMKVIYERRKSTDDKVEQYRRYKESLTNNGKNPK